MDVDVLVIPGCPGSDAASALLRRALDDIGLAVHRSPSLSSTVTKPAERVGSLALLRSSSTEWICSLAARKAGALACRVYRTPDGPRNVPDLGALREALKELAAKQLAAKEQAAKELRGRRGER